MFLVRYFFNYTLLMTNYKLPIIIYPFVFIIIFISTSCNKDKVDKTPGDIDFSKNFIDHTLAGSYWEYTTTQNGDTLTSSPANVFKQAKDSIINGNPYKVFALVQNDGTQLPFFIYRFVVNSIFEPRLFNGNPTNILEVPVVDLNRQLNETWEVQTSTDFKEILSIDSVGLNFLGFDNVFKIKRERYQNEQLISISAYYYEARVGLIYRKTIDEGTNAEFIRQLSDRDIDYN